MSGARALLPVPSRTPADAVEPDNRHLRLSSCPRCDGRKRALVEVGGRLVGRCLGCGEELPGPLDTEWHSHLVLVGRAGYGVHAVDDTGD